MFLRSLCRQERRNKLVGAHRFEGSLDSEWRGNLWARLFLQALVRKAARVLCTFAFMGQQFPQVGRSVALGRRELCRASQQLSCLLQSCPGSGGILLSISDCGTESLFKVIRGRRISREEAFATLSLFLFAGSWPKVLVRRGRSSRKRKESWQSMAWISLTFPPKPWNAFPKACPGLSHRERWPKGEI